jgi:hypothetical protein
MVELNLNIDDEVKTFNIPQSWDEVTIDQFIKLFSFDREILTEVEVSVKTMQAFTDIDEEYLLMLDLKDFHQLIELLSFTNVNLTPQSKESIIIGEDEYFIKKDFDTLSMGEMISIETIIKQTNGNFLKAIDKLLCIFLRKKKENGNLEAFRTEHMNRAESFRAIPITQVYEVFNFFLDGVNS